MKRTKKARKWRAVRIVDEDYIKIRAEAKKKGISISQMINFKFND